MFISYIFQKCLEDFRYNNLTFDLVCNVDTFLALTTISYMKVYFKFFSTRIFSLVALSVSIAKSSIKVGSSSCAGFTSHGSIIMLGLFD